MCRRGRGGSTRSLHGCRFPNIGQTERRVRGRGPGQGADSLRGAPESRGHSLQGTKSLVRVPAAGELQGGVSLGQTPGTGGCGVPTA